MIESNKRPKCFSMMLVCLLLVSAILAGSTIPVKAPVTEPIKMYAITTQNDGPGYYGGYYPILQKIKVELLKIGIDLQIFRKSDSGWYATVWEPPTWNLTGDQDGDGHHDPGVDGWDFTTCEWWMNPTSYIWLDELVYSWNTPPAGYNIMSWTNSKIDYLWQKAQTTLDSTEHNQYMWLWQEEFMHNPPVIPLYYADQWTARGAYVDGFDETAWVYDLSQLDINETKFGEVAPQTRKDIGSNTILWGAAEPFYYFFPLGVNTYSEEQLNVLKQGTLYRTSRENLMFPPSGDYLAKTNLATAFPTWRTIVEGGKEKWVARVPIKSGLTWSDGIPFNATDVAYSYNLMLSGVGYAYGDYWFMMDRVVVVDAYTVDFIYKPGMGPDYDFAGYNAHGWGIAMLPWHQLKDQSITPSNWKGKPYSKDPIPVSNGGQGVECLGPYEPIEYVANSHVKLQLRPEYTAALGWANTLPTYYILKLIPDDTARWNALNELSCDVIEYPIKPVADWLGMSRTTHKVYTFKYPAMHPLWMNLKNPILSNRYVRLAIAHAIPYPDIFSNTLPGWGISQAYPGKSFILPIHDSFDTSLGNYEYNITKAQQYMDMWRYSQANMLPYTKGPIGDHDFSGYVETGDFPTWAKWFGTHTINWKFAPGNDIDPDNDNNDYVEMLDYPLWSDNFGKHYPFYGAW